MWWGVQKAKDRLGSECWGGLELSELDPYDFRGAERAEARGAREGLAKYGRIR